MANLACFTAKPILLLPSKKSTIGGLNEISSHRLFKHIGSILIKTNENADWESVISIINLQLTILKKELGSFLKNNPLFTAELVYNSLKDLSEESLIRSTIFESYEKFYDKKKNTEEIEESSIEQEQKSTEENDGSETEGEETKDESSFDNSSIDESNIDKEDTSFWGDNEGIIDYLKKVPTELRQLLSFIQKKGQFDEILLDDQQVKIPIYYDWKDIYQYIILVTNSYNLKRNNQNSMTFDSVIKALLDKRNVEKDTINKDILDSLLDEESYFLKSLGIILDENKKSYTNDNDKTYADTFRNLLVVTLGRPLQIFYNASLRNTGLTVNNQLFISNQSRLKQSYKIMFEDLLRLRNFVKTIGLNQEYDLNNIKIDLLTLINILNNINRINTNKTILSNDKKSQVKSLIHANRRFLKNFYYKLGVDEHYFIMFDDVFLVENLILFIKSLTSESTDTKVTLIKSKTENKVVTYNFNDSFLKTKIKSENDEEVEVNKTVLYGDPSINFIEATFMEKIIEKIIESDTKLSLSFMSKAGKMMYSAVNMNLFLSKFNEFFGLNIKDWQQDDVKLFRDFYKKLSDNKNEDYVIEISENLLLKEIKKLLNGSDVADAMSQFQLGILESTMMNEMISEIQYTAEVNRLPVLLAIFQNQYNKGNNTFSYLPLPTTSNSKIKRIMHTLLLYQLNSNLKLSEDFQFIIEKDTQLLNEHNSPAYSEFQMIFKRLELLKSIDINDLTLKEAKRLLKSFSFSENNYLNDKLSDYFLTSEEIAENQKLTALFAKVGEYDYKVLNYEKFINKLQILFQSETDYHLTSLNQQLNYFRSKITLIKPSREIINFNYLEKVITRVGIKSFEIYKYKNENNSSIKDLIKNYFQLLRSNLDPGESSLKNIEDSILHVLESLIKLIDDTDESSNKTFVYKNANLFDISTTSKKLITKDNLDEINEAVKILNDRIFSLSNYYLRKINPAKLANNNLLTEIPYIYKGNLYKLDSFMDAVLGYLIADVHLNTYINNISINRILLGNYDNLALYENGEIDLLSTVFNYFKRNTSYRSPGNPHNIIESLGTQFVNGYLRDLKAPSNSILQKLILEDKEVVEQVFKLIENNQELRLYNESLYEKLFKNNTPYKNYKENLKESEQDELEKYLDINELKKILNSSSAYLSMKKTDAIDYATTTFVLQHLAQEGKISEYVAVTLINEIKKRIAEAKNIYEKYASETNEEKKQKHFEKIVKKLDYSDLLSEENLRKIDENFSEENPTVSVDANRTALNLLISKDIFIGLSRNSNLQSEDLIFDKNSTRGLFPTSVKSSKLDMLRMVMELSDIDRISHDTSIKTDVSQISNSKSNVFWDLTDKENVTLEKLMLFFKDEVPTIKLDWKDYSNQVETTDSDKSTFGSQSKALILLSAEEKIKQFIKNGIRYTNEHNSKTGKDLFIEMQEVWKSIYEISAKLFRDKITTNGVVNKELLIKQLLLNLKRNAKINQNDRDSLLTIHQLIKDLKSKDSNIQDIAIQNMLGISLDTLDIDKIQDFMIPLMISPNSYKFQSVLNSMFEHKITSAGVKGILTADVQTKLETLTSIDKYKQNIVFTNSEVYDGSRELKDMRIVEGEVLPAEIIISWNFKEHVNHYIKINNEKGDSNNIELIAYSPNTYLVKNQIEEAKLITSTEKFVYSLDKSSKKNKKILKKIGLTENDIDELKNTPGLNNKTIVFIKQGDNLYMEVRSNKKEIMNIYSFIDLEKYEETGEMYLKLSNLPEELLQGFGNRIPTQLKSSMVYFKIVGFIAGIEKSVMIAPSDFLVRMGSDFDIDTLYSLLYNRKYNKANNTFKLIHEKETYDFSKYFKYLDEKLDGKLNNFLKINYDKIKKTKDINQIDKFVDKLKKKLKDDFIQNFTEFNDELIKNKYKEYLEEIGLEITLLDSNNMLIEDDNNMFVDPSWKEVFASIDEEIRNLEDLKALLQYRLNVLPDNDIILKDSENYIRVINITLSETGLLTIELSKITNDNQKNRLKSYGIPLAKENSSFDDNVEFIYFIEETDNDNIIIKNYDNNYYQLYNKQKEKIQESNPLLDLFLTTLFKAANNILYNPNFLSDKVLTSDTVGILSFEAFKHSQLSKTKSLKALKNQMLDLYLTAMIQENSFKEAMMSLDYGYIWDDSKPLNSLALKSIETNIQDINSLQEQVKEFSWLSLLEHYSLSEINPDVNNWLYNELTYQQARSTATFIGAMALNQVFQALFRIQGNDLNLTSFKFINGLSIENDIHFYNGNTQLKPKKLFEKELIDDGFDSKFTLKVHEGSLYVSLGVDDSKIQTLGRVNFTELNINAIIGLTNLGYKYHWALLLMNQPIIKEFNRLVSEKIADSQKKDEAILEAIEELNYKYSPKDAEDDIVTFDDIKPTLFDMYKSIITQNDTTNDLNDKNRYNYAQILYLNNYLLVYELGDRLSGLYTTFNVDAKGNGATFLSLLSKVNSIEEIYDNYPLKGADKFLGNRYYLNYVPGNTLAPVSDENNIYDFTNTSIYILWLFIQRFNENVLNYVINEQEPQSVSINDQNRLEIFKNIVQQLPQLYNNTELSLYEEILLLKTFSNDNGFIEYLNNLENEVFNHTKKIVFNFSEETFEKKFDSNNSELINILSRIQESLSEKHQILVNDSNIKLSNVIIIPANYKAFSIKYNLLFAKDTLSKFFKYDSPFYKELEYKSAEILGGLGYMSDKKIKAYDISFKAWLYSKYFKNINREKFLSDLMSNLQIINSFVANKLINSNEVEKIKYQNYSTFLKVLTPLLESKHLTFNRLLLKRFDYLDIYSEMFTDDTIVNDDNDNDNKISIRKFAYELLAYWLIFNGGNSTYASIGDQIPNLVLMQTDLMAKIRGIDWDDTTKNSEFDISDGSFAIQLKQHNSRDFGVKAIKIRDLSNIKGLFSYSFDETRRGFIYGQTNVYGLVLNKEEAGELNPVISITRKNNKSNGVYLSLRYLYRITPMFKEKFTNEEEFIKFFGYRLDALKEQIKEKYNISNDKFVNLTTFIDTLKAFGGNPKDQNKDIYIQLDNLGFSDKGHKVIEFQTLNVPFGLSLYEKNQVLTSEVFRDFFKELETQEGNIDAVLESFGSYQNINSAISRKFNKENLQNENSVIIYEDNPLHLSNNISFTYNSYKFDSLGNALLFGVLTNNFMIKKEIQLDVKLKVEIRKAIADVLLEKNIPSNAYEMVYNIIINNGLTKDIIDEQNVPQTIKQSIIEKIKVVLSKEEYKDYVDIEKLDDIKYLQEKINEAVLNDVNFKFDFSSRKFKFKKSLFTILDYLPEAQKNQYLKYYQLVKADINRNLNISSMFAFHIPHLDKRLLSIQDIRKVQESTQNLEFTQSHNYLGNILLEHILTKIKMTDTLSITKEEYDKLNADGTITIQQPNTINIKKDKIYHLVSKISHELLYQDLTKQIADANTDKTYLTINPELKDLKNVIYIDIPEIQDLIKRYYKEQDQQNKTNLLNSINEKIMKHVGSKQGNLFEDTTQPKQETGVLQESKHEQFNKLPFRSKKRTFTYAGIGSRGTPQKILSEMTRIAQELEEQHKYTLQTGFTFFNKETNSDEEGADKAFSDGAESKILFGPDQYKIYKTKQVYSRKNYLPAIHKLTLDIMQEIHPKPTALKKGGQKLMARNAHQIFGDNLDTPVDFVLFWANETDNPLRPAGGTGQAVEMARRKGIPTINMANENWETQLKNLLDELEKRDNESSDKPKTTLTIEQLKADEIVQPNAIKFVRNDSKTDEAYFGEFSNFVASNQEIIDDMGLKYKSVEAYYQAQKTLIKAEREQFTSDKLKKESEYGNKAKVLGRKVTLRPDWEQVKYDVMREGLRQKFQDSEFMKSLQLTGNKQIIEWTWWTEKIWGIQGRDNNGNELKTPYKGANALGKLLMELRDNNKEVSDQSDTVKQNVKSVADIPQNLVSGKETFGTLQQAKPEIKKVLGKNPHSIDMIEAGFRTRTTRSVKEMQKYNIKVGDIVKQFGKSADGTTKTILTRITAIHPKGTPGFLNTWDKEGWTEEGIEAIKRFKDGAAAIEFEVVKSNEQIKTQSSNLTPAFTNVEQPVFITQLRNNTKPLILDNGLQSDIVSNLNLVTEDLMIPVKIKSVTRRGSNVSLEVIKQYMVSYKFVKEDTDLYRSLEYGENKSIEAIKYQLRKLKQKLQNEQSDLMDNIEKSNLDNLTIDNIGDFPPSPLITKEYFLQLLKETLNKDYVGDSHTIKLNDTIDNYNITNNNQPLHDIGSNIQYLYLDKQLKSSLRVNGYIKLLDSQNRSLVVYVKSKPFLFTEIFERFNKSKFKDEYKEITIEALLNDDLNPNTKYVLKANASDIKKLNKLQLEEFLDKVLSLNKPIGLIGNIHVNTMFAEIKNKLFNLKKEVDINLNNTIFFKISLEKPVEDTTAINDYENVADEEIKQIVTKKPIDLNEAVQIIREANPNFNANEILRTIQNTYSNLIENQESTDILDFILTLLNC